jgi:nucleotide-binding universal stress UspA family protein
MDALALACLLAKRNKGNIYAVYVVEVARALPLDANLSPEASKGEEVLVEAERVADSMDMEITGEILQAREAGSAIVDEAIERAVDVIVAGVEYNQLDEFKLGQTAQYILRNAPCHVVVSRASAERSRQ